MSVSNFQYSVTDNGEWTRWGAVAKEGIFSAVTFYMGLDFLFGKGAKTEAVEAPKQKISETHYTDTIRIIGLRYH